MSGLARRTLVFSNVVAILTALAVAQSNRGELRLSVTDPAGLGVKTTVQIANPASQYQNTLTTSDQGTLDVTRLSYGIYQLTIEQPGFAPVSESVEIRSVLPLDQKIQLKVAPVTQTVNVNASAALIDPY